MTILRTQENGGDFFAPLAVDVKMTFIPVKPARNKDARKLEIKGSVTFPASRMPWGLAQGTMKKAVAVMVDTDGDLTPDASLPGPSSFLAGQSPDISRLTSPYCSCCPGEYCHADNGEQHCTYVTMCPNTMSCC